jgi:hypothetical protein
VISACSDANASECGALFAMATGAYNVIADIWMVHAFCTALGWADGAAGPVIGKTNDIGQHNEAIANVGASYAF